jgi:hypothetical protein
MISEREVRGTTSKSSIAVSAKKGLEGLGGREGLQKLEEVE